VELKLVYIAYVERGQGEHLEKKKKNEISSGDKITKNNS
jgi:hypothetical protein